MKVFYTSICAAVLLVACQNNISEDDAIEVVNLEDESTVDPNAVPIPAPVKVPLDGDITVSVEPLVSEEAACIVPLRVSNGTENEVSVSMFGFKITGSGNDDTGNMFAQPTPSGEARTARVILLGQNCSAFDTVTINEVLCVSGGNQCADNVTFENSAELTLNGPTTTP